MQPFALTDKTRKLLWWLLAFLLVARIICNTVIPLADDTEARYGEIARTMLTSGNWITPQENGAPFWAKPPLSTWLSAFSMKLFGVNEFGARLPSTLLGIGMLALIWLWCAPRRGRDFALAACTILAGMSLFFMAGGAVMTDSSLAICTTLTMVSFWQAMHPEQLSPGRHKLWGYLFFVGLGFGLLAKGPVVGVLTLLPILPWLHFHKNKDGSRQWLRAWQLLPWFSGSALMILIGVPWYLIAEHRTPGFIAYFILGENLGRFFDRAWRGDKYGNPHVEPLGMIWGFWLISALPWSFVFLAKLKNLLHNGRDWIAASDGWISYLLLWSFMPVAFFTFAHNIIWPYTLPALPAFAVLMTELLVRANNAKPLGARLASLTFITPTVLLVIAGLYATHHDGMLKSSQKQTARYYLKVRPNADSGLYFYHRNYFSGEFYSDGKARKIADDKIPELFHDGRTDFLVIYADDLARMNPAWRAHFHRVKTFGQFVLLEESDASPATAPPPP